MSEVKPFFLIKKPFEKAVNQRLHDVLEQLSSLEDDEKNTLHCLYRDFNKIERLLQSSQDLRQAKQKAVVKQEAYNKAIVANSLRWKKSEKDFNVSKSIAHVLGFKKNEFNEAHSNLKNLKEKIRKIKLFSKKKGHKKDIWEKLKKWALLLDRKDKKKRRVKLIQLEKSWRAQGPFAHLNIKDILIIRNSIDPLLKLIKYFQNSFKHPPENKVDLEIVEFLSKNRAIIEELSVQANQAVIWRVNAASMREDLFFDDAFWALNQSIAKIFTPAELKVKKDITHALQLSSTSWSNSFSIASWHKCEQIISQNFNKKVKSNPWLTSVWANKPEFKPIFKLTEYQGYLVPQSIKPWLPNHLGWTIGNWLRYYFFNPIAHKLKSWLSYRNYFLGRSTGILVGLNEGVRQNTKLATALSQDKNLRLYNINEHPGFKSALQVLPLIQEEEKRVLNLKPTWTTGVLLRWVPFFNRFQTYQFFDHYLKKLNFGKLQLNHQTRISAGLLVKKVDEQLTQELAKRVSLLSESLINDIELFVNSFGSQEDKDKLKEIFNPLKIINRYTFILPKESSTQYRGLDFDAVYSFYFFAKKYWEKNHKNAAKLLVKLLVGKWFPRNQDEDEQLLKIIREILPSKNPEKAFLKLMRKIARIVTLCGDDSNPDAYRFLKRYYKKGSHEWDLRKKQKLKDKFSLFVQVFNQRNNQEFSLDDPSLKEFHQGISLGHFKRYLDDLNKAHPKSQEHLSKLHCHVKKYVSAYKGNNAKYISLMFELCVSQKLDIELFEKYLSKRLKWCLAQKQKKYGQVVLPEEYSIYFKLKEYPSLIKTVQHVVQKNYTGENIQLAELLFAHNQPATIALYAYKRFMYLFEHNQVKQAIREKEIFQQLKDNKQLIKMQSIFFDKWLVKLEKNEDPFCKSRTQKEAWFEFFAPNKELARFRNWALNECLKSNNFKETRGYFKRLNYRLQAQNAIPVFASNTNEKAWESQVEKHLNELSRQNLWNANTQYTIEVIPHPKKETFLQSARFLWFKEWIVTPQRFSLPLSANRASVDLSYHEDNLALLNKKQNVLQVFGPQNLKELVRLVHLFLDKFESFHSHERIGYITKIINDDALLVKNYLLKAKLGHLQLTLKVLNDLKNEEFEKARIGIGALKSKSSSFPKEHEIQATFLNHHRLVEEQIMDQYKSMTIHLKGILQGDSDQFSKDPLFLEKSKLMRFDFLSDRLTQQKKDFLKVRGRIKRVLENLVVPLKKGKIEKIQLTKTQVGILREGLSTQDRKDLAQWMMSFFDFAKTEDPLVKGFFAFARLVKDEYTSVREKQKDQAILVQYDLHKTKFKDLVNKQTDQMVKCLKEGKSLSQFAIIPYAYKTQMSSFITLLSSKKKKKLQKTLLKVIKKWNNSLKVKSQIASVEEWRVIGQLFKQVFNNKIEDPLNGQEQVNKMCSEHLKKFKHYIKDIHEQLERFFDSGSDFSVLKRKVSIRDFFSGAKDLEEKGNALINFGLFVRHFGEPKQVTQLDEWIDTILNQQRKAMMNSPFVPEVQSFLEFADDMAYWAGNSRQKAENAQLVKDWSIFRNIPAPVLGQPKGKQVADKLRHQIQVKAAYQQLTPFAQKFEKEVFKYFCEKFWLKNDFLSEMMNKREQWCPKSYFQSHEFLAKHPIDKFKALLDHHLDRKHHNWFSKIPTQEDAQKLFAAFCLSARAYQLKDIWSKRIEQNGPPSKEIDFLTVFKPLQNLFGQLKKEFNLRGGFTKKVEKALSETDDLFAQNTHQSSKMKRLK